MPVQIVMIAIMKEDGLRTVVLEYRTVFSTSRN